MITLPGDPTLPPGCSRRMIDGPDAATPRVRCRLDLAQAEWTFEDIATLAAMVRAKPRWKKGRALIHWQLEFDTWDTSSDMHAEDKARAKFLDGLEDGPWTPAQIEKLDGELWCKAAGFESGEADRW